MSDYLLRSLMFVPAHNKKLLDHSIQTDADVLLLDLEDSVQPPGNKALARGNIMQYMTDKAFRSHQVFPRVNDRESGELLKDLYDLTLPGIDGFMYPKSQTGEDIYFLDKLLETIEYEKGMPVGTFKIIPLIETASAVLHAEEIATASPRVIAIAFGNEDYLSDIQGTNDEQASPLFTARSMIAMAAHSAGVVPIDTVHIKVHDLEDLEFNLQIAAKLGFQGMLALHPKELPLIHRYFSPGPEELSEAKKIVAAARKSEAEGVGVKMKDGQFIGPPIVRNAQKVIRRHNMIKSKKQQQQP